MNRPLATLCGIVAAGAITFFGSGCASKFYQYESMHYNGFVFEDRVIFEETKEKHGYNDILANIYKQYFGYL